MERKEDKRDKDDKPDGGGGSRRMLLGLSVITNRKLSWKLMVSSIHCWPESVNMISQPKADSIQICCFLK